MPCAPSRVYDSPAMRCRLPRCRGKVPERAFACILFFALACTIFCHLPAWSGARASSSLGQFVLLASLPCCIRFSLSRELRLPRFPCCLAVVLPWQPLQFGLLQGRGEVAVVTLGPLSSSSSSSSYSASSGPRSPAPPPLLSGGQVTSIHYFGILCVYVVSRVWGISL